MLNLYKSTNSKYFTCSEKINYLSFLKIATDLILTRAFTENSFKLLQSLSSMYLMFVSLYSLVRLVKHWHRLPREVVEAPSLQTSKARLDGALSNLV